MHASICETLLLASSALTLSLLSARAQTGAPRVTSPNGQIEMVLSTGAATDTAGQLAYEVSFQGKPVLARSELGLDIQGQRLLGDRVKIISVTSSSGDETYRMVHGKSNPVRDQYNAIRVELAETERLARRLNLEARAYNDGIAFRYVVPDQRSIKELRLASERTSFRLAKDATTYPLVLRGYRTSYEDDYAKRPLSGLNPNDLIALPFLVELPGIAWVAITEAHIDNYAGMYLSHSRSEAHTLEARLAPRIDEPGLAVSGQTPVTSPWRVIMIASEPGKLIESNMVINLNPPCAIADTSWIKPGKTAWDWWSGSQAKNVSFQPGMNTETMMHYIDFAASAGLEYMLIDAGWAAGGTGPNDSGSDLSKSRPQVNLEQILKHARSKNVGVWLWAHWTDIDRQMDEVFPLFREWGIVGVKIDFMDRDDQWMVNWYRRVVKKAAEHRLMIDFHGAFKPDGLRRTYPNLLTREGVMGMEYSKWSARVTPEHNVILPFTRMLAGPMDYTPGGFDNVTREEFVPRNRFPTVMGTRAHQLAMYVVYESALQMLSDYPEAYAGQKELEFLRVVPAAWDETRVLNGLPGEYVTIARRRGNDWFVGSMNGWTARELEISLNFLGPREYMAEIYADGPDAEKNPKQTIREEKRVTAATRLKIKMASGGGQAIRIR